MTSPALEIQCRRLLGETPPENADWLTLVRAIHGRRPGPPPDSLDALCAAITEDFHNFVARFNADIQADRLNLLYSSLLLFIGGAMARLQAAASNRTVQPGEARALQNALLHAAGYLDDIHGGALEARLQQALAPLEITESPQPPPQSDALRTLLATIVLSFDTLSEEVYAALQDPG